MSNGARHKRVFRELTGFTQNTDATIPQDWNISLVNEDNIFEWKATSAGPDNTSYKHGIFEVNIKFGTEYPFKPPTVVFRSKMFHPNIASDGRICLDTLGTAWTPAMTVKVVLFSLMVLLQEPNNETQYYKKLKGIEREKLIIESVWKNGNVNSKFEGEFEQKLIETGFKVNDKLKKVNDVYFFK